MIQTYTSAEVGQMLGKGEGWVDAQARKKNWPHLRIGKSIRFTDDHLDSIVKLLAVKPSPKAAADNSWGRQGRGGAKTVPPGPKPA